jgi:ABC-type branched-subunit amino acid transport system substrate-binding protein
MFARLTTTHKPFLARVFAPLTLMFAAIALAACDPATIPGATGPRVDTSQPVQVALLVPGGSGQSGDESIAQSLENAARLAVRDLAGAQIDLRVYNTGGRADQAARVAAEAVEDGASIILGPVFSDAARAAGQAVASRNVNVLSFSNNTTVAGGNVFVLGPTFDTTAARLASYAVREGKSRILVVHERNESGELGRRAIERAITASGGSLAGSQGFDFSQQGVVDALPQIAGAARSGNADALFFTSDTAGALPLLAQLLPENRVGPQDFQYIGLTRWDIPSSTLELSGVQGGWFALPDPSMTAQFRSRYQAAYGQDPHPIAGLGYDGIAAIGALISSGGSGALSRASLTQASGFAGVGGVFRLRADGTNERGLAVAEIRDGEVVVIDPAPRSFPGAGL